jgi:type VI secretion system secreted protein VgrG
MIWSRLFHLEVEGASCVWRIAGVTGRERLHGSFAFRVLAEPMEGDLRASGVEPEDLITKTARLRWPLESVGERVVEGIVDEVRRERGHYEIVIVPRVAMLADSSDYRVFVDQDACTIARTVLGHHGIALETRIVRSLPKRAQCVQSFESDLAFVSRILSEEGVAWFLPRERPDVLIATDNRTGFDLIEDPLPIMDAGGLVTGRSAYRARLRRRVVTDRVTLRDYDFESPKLDLTAEAKGKRSDLESYEFPGGFRDPALGKALAQIRREEKSAMELVLDAESTARDLAPGCLVEMPGEPAERQWLLVEVTHESVEEGPISNERLYRARFLAIPAGTAYRPARQEPPRAPGVQHATTTGPRALEIHTEGHGRVKTLLRWDRRGTKDDRSSAWLRTMQPPTSGGFFLPRVDWEVLVGFSGYSADSPMVLGRLYNGEITPPHGLPANKVVSAFGTRTTPGGGSANGMTLDDTAGHEGMTFGASADYNERTENDKVTVVAANEKASVSGNRKLMVGQVHGIEVAGAQTHSVGGSRSLNVNANMGISTGPESISIGGLRTFKVGGDSSIACAMLSRLVGGAKAELDIEHETREVGGASTTLVGGSWNVVAAAQASVSVGGASAELVGGPKKVTTGSYFLEVKGGLKLTLGSWTTKAGASHDLGFNADSAMQIAGSAKIKGSDVTIAAESKLTIKASGITIEMTPSAVTITGRFDGSIASVDQGDEQYA